MPDYDPADPRLATIAFEAILALGRLDGALAICQPSTLRLFAIRLLRTTLTTALRQEGHAFTDQRFHAWFAGLATLSDHPPREVRAPKIVCEAILTELTHSSWEPLARLAARFLSALLAPQDHIGSAAAGETAHEDARAIIAAGRNLIAQLEPATLPLSALAGLHLAMGQHVLFAPSERAHSPISLGPIRLTVERPALPSPRWALEILWGGHWRDVGLLAHALPFPGLIRLDAVRASTASQDMETGDLEHILATSLRDAAQTLRQGLIEVEHQVRRLAQLHPGKRNSSRAPALLELLVGFGPMRSTQLEALLGATRLGVRAMVSALDDIRVLKRVKHAGVHLYYITLDADPTALGADKPRGSFALSAAALHEYNASMADIDALLARSRPRGPI